MYQKIYSDEDLISAYLKYGSTTKAAKHIEASYETIRRACKRNGVNLDGRKFNGKTLRNNMSKKAADDELLEECKSMSRLEIAKKHNMNLCNVDRRLKRLGIKCKPGTCNGSGKYHYMERADAFGCEYDDSITLDFVYKKYNGVCQICGTPVDVNDRCGNGIGKKYPTLDHIIPLSKGGTHTENNVQLAHMICNSKKGARM